MKRFLLLLPVLLAGCSSPAPDPWPPLPTGSSNSIPAFSQVEPGIYRGGQPDAAGWVYLRSIGVSNVIALHTEDERSDSDATALGLKVWPIPIATLAQLEDGPDPAAMRRAVACMVPGTFVHCDRGRDRTGLVVGLYRLKEGWPKQAAWAEMLGHGYHPALRGLTDFWDLQ